MAWGPDQHWAVVSRARVRCSGACRSARWAADARTRALVDPRGTAGGAPVSGEVQVREDADTVGDRQSVM